MISVAIRNQEVLRRITPEQLAAYQEIQRNRPNTFLAKSRKGREKVLEYHPEKARHGVLYAILYPDGRYVLRSRKKHKNGKPVQESPITERGIPETAGNPKRRRTPEKRAPRIPADFTPGALARFNELLVAYGTLNSPVTIEEGKRWRIIRFNRETRRNEHIGVLYGDGRISRDLLHEERLAGLTEEQKAAVIDLEEQYGRLSVYRISNRSCQLRKTYWQPIGRVTIGTVYKNGGFLPNRNLPESLRADEPTQKIDLSVLRRESP